MATKVYTVQGPDGPISVEGPEGASDAEVIAQAKRLYAQSKATAQPSEEPTPTVVPPVSQADAIARQKAAAASAPAQVGAAPQGILSTAWKTLNDAAGNNTPKALLDILDYFTKNSLNDKLADASGLVRDAASGAVGGAAALASGGLAGSFAAAGADQVLRKVTGQGTGGTLLLPDNSIGATLEGGAINEIGGRIAEFIGRGGAALLDKTRIKGMTKELENLHPTYGQVTGHDLVENLFAKGAKEHAVGASTTAAYDRTKEIVGEITERTEGGQLIKTVANLARRGPTNSKLAEVMQAEVKQGFKNSVNASNAEATKFLGLAEMNPLSIPQKPQVVDTGLRDSMGAPTTKSVPVPDKVVAGPIALNKTLNLAADIANTMKRSAVPPDPENPVLRAIDGLFSATGTVLDKNTGTVLAHEPISAGDAWKTKQTLDALGYGSPVEGLNAVDSRFKDLSKALNTDIDKSVETWPNNATGAQDSWQTAKAIVSQRNKLFSPLGETGAGTKTLLNTVNAPDPAVESIINDRMKLQRFLATGDMKVNGRQISASNARRDMQGYAINRIWDKGFTSTVPGNPSVGTANGAKMATDWIEFANSEQGKQLFSRQQVANYNDFFDAVRKTTTSPNGSTRWVTLNVGTRTVALSTAILSGAAGLSAGTIGSAGVVGGALTLAGVARIMASKKWAPVFLAMTHNRPLGMSFQAAARGIMQALSGAAMTIQKSDGSTVDGTIGTDGVFRPAKNSSDATIAK